MHLRDSSIKIEGIGRVSVDTSFDEGYYSTCEELARPDLRPDPRYDDPRRRNRYAEHPMSDRFDALVAALCLAVLAPSEEQMAKAVELAESLAVGFTEEEVIRAKLTAQEALL